MVIPFLPSQHRSSLSSYVTVSRLLRHLNIHFDLPFRSVSFRHPSKASTMVRRHISTELKETALSMSLQGISDAEIREITGISERSLKRLRSTHRRTGGVVPPPPIDLGRPRVLSAIHVKVRTRNISILVPISLYVVSLRLR